MLFPTPEYALLFATAFVFAWGCRSIPAVHRTGLLLLSWLFYAWGAPEYLPLLIGVSLLATLVAQGIGRTDRPAARKALLVVGVAGPLFALAVFKYLGFAASNVAEAAGQLGFDVHVPIPEVVLPLGISFFVFHAISLVVDTWRRDSAPPRLTDGLLYIAFFPALVAGPIVRAAAFLPQLQNPPDPNRIESSRGIALILRGLFKKVVLSSHLGILLADPLFEAPDQFSGLQTLAGIYAYAGQIYCDFSGYTDIAIGSALLLGYHFDENFNTPYRAASIQEFWHRWHISLSSFLRDYLYIPLGGSRDGAFATYRNLFLTMLIGGLWHGAAWTFVIWGALHGFALVVNRLWSRLDIRWIQRLRHARAWRWVSTIVTFHVVCLGWVFFRAQDLDTVMAVLARLAEPGAMPLAVVVALVVAGVGLQWMPSAWWHRSVKALSNIPPVLQGVVAAVAVIVIDATGPIGVPPFIYFQF